LLDAQSPKCPYEAYSPACDDGDIYDGEYWWGIWWVPSLIPESAWRTPIPRYTSGRAVWYAAGVMEATAEYRGIPLDGTLGGVALMSPSDIGKTVYINGPLGWEGPFVVVDCAQYEDAWPIIRYRKEVVEVSWGTKERWGMISPVDVEVAVADSPYALWRVLETSPVVDFPEWWLALDNSGIGE